jgi:hypothetical protein
LKWAISRSCFAARKTAALGRDALAEQTPLETEMRVVHDRPCLSQTLWQAESAVPDRAVRKTASQLCKTAAEDGAS